MKVVNAKVQRVPGWFASKVVYRIVGRVGVTEWGLYKLRCSFGLGLHPFQGFTCKVQPGIAR